MIEHDEHFRVQATTGNISHVSSVPQPNAFLLAPNILNPIEIIKLRPVKNVNQLLKEAYTAHMTLPIIAAHARELEASNLTRREAFVKTFVEWKATRTK